MAKVGRPSSRTRTGAIAPTREIGVPGYGIGAPNAGVAYQSFPGMGAGPWQMFTDEWEYVPELQWPNSVRLYDQMRTDSQLAGLLTAVMWGISQLRFVVDPNGCPDQMVREISEDLNVPILGQDDAPVGRYKGRFSHKKHITQSMLSAIYGHMYFNIKGEIRDGKWRLRKLAPRMPQSIRQINVAEDGGLVSIIQYASANQALSMSNMNGIEIPVDNLVAYIFMQEGMNWVGRSFMRDCYRDWLIKDRNLRIESINHERAGGVPYANAPMGATVDEVDELSLMMQNFRIGETSGGALPFGAELNIAKGTGSDVDSTIKRLDESMARRFLLQLANLAQGGQHVGSYALSETFEDFFLVGQREIAQWHCDVTTEHLIEDIIDWNYGEETERTPRLTWERSSEDSLGSEVLGQLVGQGVITMDQELEDWVRYRYLMPKKKEPRPELQPGSNKPLAQQSDGPAAPTAPSTAAGSGAPVLPPASGPAVKASFWDRIKRKPDVAASAAMPEPSWVTIKDVPVMEAGVEYNLSTGGTTFTPEDLADVVMAINEDRSIPPPRLGIGHVDPRFNDKDYLKTFDGEPTWGTLEKGSARLSENGMVVYANYAGVPAWLGKIMPYAFPSRSIEGFWDVESQMGKKYRFVLACCKVLGIQWPGINQLEDLPRYLGEEVPADVVVDPRIAAAAAAGSQPGGDPVKWLFGKTAASANLDDVRRAWHRDFRDAEPSRAKWWIRQVLVDPNEVVAEDDDSGQLYRLTFQTDAKGAVTFGDPEPVRVGLIPDDISPELRKTAASSAAELLAVGRTVMASYSTRAESSPEPTGGAMDPKEIRKQLNLPEDASDEQVTAALLARAGLTQPAAEPVAPAATPVGDPAATQPTPTPTPTPTPAPEPAPQPTTPPAQEAQPLAASAATPGTLTVDKGAWEQMQATTAAAANFLAQQAKKDRETLVAAAMGDGRIPPASKDHWLGLLEEDPNAAATLASLAPGLVPVEERGHAHSPDTAATAEMDGEQVGQWTASLFPETRQLRALEAAAASGEPVNRPRVISDAFPGR